MEAFVDAFKDIIYGGCAAAVIMILAVILHRMKIIDFDILEWFKSKKERG